MSSPSQMPQLPGYRCLRALGSGGTADVWLVEREEGGVFAAKVYRADAGVSGRREWQVLRRHSDPHIVTCHDLLADEQGRSVLIVDYLAGGSLSTVVRGRSGLTSGEVITALAPIAGALGRMHDLGDLHGDLSPSNILFDDVGRPVMTDLGATAIPAMAEAPEWGSARYVAPEVADGEPATSASDVYSLAATAWFALVGEPPGQAAIRPHLMDVVPDVPAEIAEVITAALAITPSARPCAFEFEAALRHAGEPEPVPLDRRRGAAAGCAIGAQRSGAAAVAATETPPEADDITTRLRQQAQERQKHVGRRAALEREQERAERRTRQRRRGVVLVAGVITLGAGGLMWAGVGGAAPERSHSPQQAASPTSTASKPTTASAVVAKAGRTSVSSPTPARGSTQEWSTRLKGLLACRADAWNSGKAARLDDCLAEGSPAEQSEQAQLKQAAQIKASYEGLSYDIVRLSGVKQTAQKVTMQVQLRTSVYTVTVGGKKQSIPSATDSVEFVLTQTGSSWKISQWSTS